MHHHHSMTRHLRRVTPFTHPHICVRPQIPHTRIQMFLRSKPPENQRSSDETCLFQIAFDKGPPSLYIYLVAN